MTVALNTVNLFEIGTYGGLSEAVAHWLDRDDYTDRIPYFIALAEAQFRRVITSPQREVVLSVTGNTLTLPDDFDSVRSVSVSDPPTSMVHPISADGLYSRYANFSPGRPLVYAHIGDQLVFAPSADQTYSIRLAYQGTIPPLNVANQTNWLITRHPDAYLFGTLLQAEFYGWTDDRLPLIKSALDEKIAEINQETMRRRYAGGPLVMRANVEADVWDGVSRYR